MTYFVYLLECADKSLYCGITNDLENRVQRHNAGKGAKYTKVRRPVRLVYFEECSNKSAALKREFALKKLDRREKLALIV